MLGIIYKYCIIELKYDVSFVNDFPVPDLHLSSNASIILILMYLFVYSSHVRIFGYLVWNSHPAQCEIICSFLENIWSNMNVALRCPYRSISTPRDRLLPPRGLFLQKKRGSIRCEWVSTIVDLI